MITPPAPARQANQMLPSLERAHLAAMSVEWTNVEELLESERPATLKSWLLTVAAVYHGPRDAMPVTWRDSHLPRRRSGHGGGRAGPGYYET
jgi:hypothetical protein